MSPGRGEAEQVTDVEGGMQSFEWLPDGQWIAFVSMAGKTDWISNYYVYLVRPDGSGLRNASQAFDDLEWFNKWVKGARPTTE